MAETRDRAPSARKLSRATERGDVPVSAAVLFAAALLGAVLGAAATGQQSLERARAWLRASLESPEGAGRLASGAKLLGQATEVAWLTLAPVLAGALAALVLAGVLQVGLVFRARAVAPELSRLAASRRPSLRDRALDLGFSSLFCVSLALASVAVLAPSLRGLLALGGADPASAGRLLLGAVAELAPSLLVVFALVAIADLVQRRVRHALRLRMTRVEQADELRETEGDPRMRAARRDRMRAGTGTAR